MMSGRNRIKEISVYIGAVVICVSILAWVMKLWRADMSIPFSYAGDTLLYFKHIKSTIDNGWYLHNEFLGMPYGSDMHDYPLADNFHFLLLKLISLFVLDHAMIGNIYYLLGFPLTTITSLFVFRRFNISCSVSIVGSLLFAFLPYHFMRGEAHLFLVYYMIPLIIYVILRVHLGEPLLFRYVKGNSKLKLDLSSFKSISCIAICLVVASTGVYYAFFSCFLLFIAGISAFLRQRNVYHLIVSGILIALISVWVYFNISPTIIYKYRHGDNKEAVQRDTRASEIYGMKIAQLLLPVSGHRISLLHDLKHKYNAGAPLVNENDTSTLGTIGNFGFLILIGWLFYRKSESGNAEKCDSRTKLLSRLSILNLSAVLLATTGGFGSLFALLVSPKIRSYNRISVFIAFFSLFALAILLDRFSKRFVKSITSKFIFYGFLCLILLLGILDQTTRFFVPDYTSLKEEYISDSDFVGKIEVSVPDSAMIFQLPYHPYPEFKPEHKMSDYDLFKGYLHSKKLRWSYGAMKGRKGDNWLIWVAAMSPGRLVETLAVTGFSGIYLDRYGYADMGRDLEKKLSALLNTKPIVSTNNKLVFFNMMRYSENLKEKYTDIEWASKQEIALHPLSWLWEGGFSGLEGKPEDNWRWCSSEGILHIVNTSQQERKFGFEMTFSTGYEEFSNLLIDSPLFSESLKINNKAKSFSKKITIPHGEHYIKFLCDAKRVDAPLDSRSLVFRVNNFMFKVIQ